MTSHTKAIECTLVPLKQLLITSGSYSTANLELVTGVNFATVRCAEMHILALLEPSKNNLEWAGALASIHEVCLVYTVREAVSHLEMAPCDLVISNVYMENEDAFELLRHMRSHSRLASVPFICLVAVSSEISGRLNAQMANAFMSLGAAGYITLDNYRDHEKINAKLLRHDIELLAANNH